MLIHHCRLTAISGQESCFRVPFVLSSLFLFAFAASTVGICYIFPQSLSSDCHINTRTQYHYISESGLFFPCYFSLCFCHQQQGSAATSSLNHCRLTIILVQELENITFPSAVCSSLAISLHISAVNSRYLLYSSRKCTSVELLLHLLSSHVQLDSVSYL